LRDLWEDSSIDPEQRTSFQYVLDLQERLHECSELAVQESEISVNKYRNYFDLKSQDRKFVVGSEVLVLLPDSHNKLLTAWRGPYTVLEKCGKYNYVININGSRRMYHVNLLKQYLRRASVNQAFIVDDLVAHASPVQADPFFVCQNCVIDESSLDVEQSGAVCELPVDYWVTKTPLTSNSLGDPPAVGTVEGGEFSSRQTSFPRGQSGLRGPPAVAENIDECPSISSELTTDQIQDIEKLLTKYNTVLSPLPGKTSTIKYDIELQSTAPVRARYYPEPVHLREVCDGEIKKMLELDLIEPTDSPYSAPIVMVKKPDSSYRLTMDFRDLNSVTVVDAGPPCLVEEDLFKFSQSKYFSELDLTRAYYQIELAERSEPLTAFSTHLGQMAWKRLPFGLVNACTQYAKLMRIVLAG
jgi:hypothetical protein